MTVEQLKKANEIAEKIESSERLLNACITQETEYIVFTHGNGSAKSSVCVDKKVIEEVRQLLIARHTEKLEKLREEFQNI